MSGSRSKKYSLLSSSKKNSRSLLPRRVSGYFSKVLRHVSNRWPEILIVSFSSSERLDCFTIGAGGSGFVAIGTQPIAAGKRQEREKVRIWLIKFMICGVFKGLWPKVIFLLTCSCKRQPRRNGCHYKCLISINYASQISALSFSRIMLFEVLYFMLQLLPHSHPTIMLALFIKSGGQWMNWDHLIIHNFSSFLPRLTFLCAFYVVSLSVCP